MSAFVIHDPRAMSMRAWHEILDALQGIFPALEVMAVKGRGEAARLTRDALRDGHLDVIAVGGDGLVNEALNGFFDRGRLVSPEAVFSFVSTGGHIATGFGIAPGAAAGLLRLRQSHIRRVDVGRIACLSAAGEPLLRHFLGHASFGLSGRIALQLRRAHVARFFGKGFTFWLHSRIAILKWHACLVRLMAPLAGGGSFDEIAGIASVGLVPRGDGLLDMTVTGGRSRPALLRGMGGGRDMTVARLTAAPTVDTIGPVEVETDGESAGVLPATFEVLPHLLNMRL